MANTNININITATGKPAIDEIKKVEDAVTKLGTTATTTISVAGLEDVTKQVKAVQKEMVALTSKATGGNLKMNAGLSPSATADLKNWGATAVLASANATNGFKNYENQLKKVSSNVEDIGSRLRYLSLVTAVAFAGMTKLVSGFVNAAKEAETGQMKLMVAAQATGDNYENLSSKAQQLVSATGGILDLAVATESLSNAQLSMGDSEKAYQFVLRMTETALVKKQNATDSVSEAVKKTTVGMLAYKEVMFDSAGAEIKLKEAEIAYANEFKNGNQNLTEREKRLAMYNAAMKQTAQYAGMASLASSTFSGSLLKMNSSVKLMKTNLGDALVPVIGTLATLIDSTALKISNFAKENSEMTMGIIVGGTFLAGFFTIVAGGGALLEMFSTGVAGLASVFKVLLQPAILTTIIQSVALIAIIGGLTYAFLKLTNRWDIWKNRMSVLGTKIKDAIGQFSDATDEANDTVKKLQKALDGLQTTINDTTSDFNQQMAEWVADHDKNISKLKVQITDLANDYEKATKKIKNSFSDAMSDMSLSHSRKTEDLQREIDEEISKGVWADQTKIRDLQRELKRENEDYAIASQDKIDTKEEQLIEEEKQYNEKLANLQAELKKEEELEAKHSALISYYRTQPYLDELEKMAQNRDRQLRDQKEQLVNINETYGAQKTGINGVADSLNDLSKIADETGQLQVRSLKEGLEEWWNNLDATDKVGVSIVGISTALLGVASLIGLGGKVSTALAGFYASMGVGNTIAGFAAGNTLASSLLSLLGKIAVPIGIVIDLYMVYEAINAVVSWKNEVNALKEAEDRESASKLSYLKTLNSELKAGKKTAEEYNNVLKNIGLGDWSNGSYKTTSSISLNDYFYTTPNVSKKALGGNVYDNVPYIVGEKGPELFVPSGNGNIIPNDKMGGNNITINVNNPSVRSDNDIIAIANQVKQIFSRQQALKQYM